MNFHNHYQSWDNKAQKFLTSFHNLENFRSNHIISINQEALSEGKPEEY